MLLMWREIVDVSKSKEILISRISFINLTDHFIGDELVMNVTYLTVELVTGFFLLFLLVKVLGKKIIDQITPFTFIAAIVLSELLGNAVYDEEISIGYIVYA